MSRKDNLSVVIHKKDDLRVEQTPFPGLPGPEEVQISTHTVGICGSDIHFWKDGRIDKFAIESPLITGHEASGTVIAIGSNVKDLKIGDRVAIEPGIPCMNCFLCKNGDYNLCEEVTFHACPPWHGSLRRYFNHNASFCHKIPDNLSFGEGALIEPLSVAVYACERADIQLGMQQKVLVVGAGPVGLLSALSAQALGAGNVCISDINADRLDIAKDLGIKNTYLIRGNDIQANLAEIKKLLGNSIDITLECSGSESGLTMGIRGTRDGGKVIMVGLGPDKVSVPLVSAACRQVDMLGIKRYKNTFPRAIRMVSSGVINIKPLITHKFSIENAIDAFEMTKNQADGSIKVQIKCFKE